MTSMSISKEVMESARLADRLPDGPTAAEPGLVSKRMYLDGDVRQNGGAPMCPLGEAVFRLGSHAFRLYYAIWEAEEGVVLYSGMLAMLKWSESKLKRMLNELCSAGLAVRVSTGRSEGRTGAKPMAILALACPVEGGARTRQILTLGQLPDRIRRVIEPALSRLAAPILAAQNARKRQREMERKRCGGRTTRPRNARSRITEIAETPHTADPHGDQGMNLPEAIPG